MVIKTVSSLVLLLWPVFIASGFYFDKVKETAAVLLGLCLIRLLLLKAERKVFKEALGLVTIIAVLLCLAVLILNRTQFFLYYPAAVSFIMLAVFFSSLYAKTSAVEKIARLSDPNLPEFAVRYTRKVTKAWCLFFLANGSFALITALLGDYRLWTLYNCLISYILMGLMFAGEYLIRIKVKKQHDRT